MHSYRKSFVVSVLDTTNPETGYAQLQYQTQCSRTVLDVLEQHAVLGETTYDITRQLSLTAGARWLD